MSRLLDQLSFGRLQVCYDRTIFRCLTIWGKLIDKGEPGKAKQTLDSLLNRILFQNWMAPEKNRLSYTWVEVRLLMPIVFLTLKLLE
jgi:hypothetical protein